MASFSPDVHEGGDHIIIKIQIPADTVPGCQILRQTHARSHDHTTEYLPAGKRGIDDAPRVVGTGHFQNRHPPGGKINLYLRSMAGIGVGNKGFPAAFFMIPVQRVVDEGSVCRRRRAGAVAQRHRFGKRNRPPACRHKIVLKMNRIRRYSVFFRQRRRENPMQRARRITYGVPAGEGPARSNGGTRGRRTGWSLPDSW
jgi:hypothetical protein